MPVRKSLAITCIAACVVSVVHAQTASNDGNAVAKGGEPFNDPGDGTASALAKMEGIPLGEAKRRLKIMNEAARLASRLEAAYPNDFAGLSVESRPRFKVLIRFTSGSNSEAYNRVRQYTNDQDLLASFGAAETPIRSRQAARALARTLKDRMRRAGLAPEVATNTVTGEIKVLSTKPEAVRSAIQRGLLNLPADIPIEEFEGIQLTASVGGGVMFNGQNDNCTTGFTVVHLVTRVKGVSTAGHCSDLGLLSIVPSSQYPTGSSLRFQREWFGSGSTGMDIQWSSSVGYTLEASFVPDTGAGGKTYVTGAQGDYAGLFVCKNGRTTYKTCGYVDPWQYPSPGYGDMPRVNASAAYPAMTLGGDSGGPVYTGSLVVGTVHGKGATSGSLYYVPFRHWSQNGLDLAIVCIC